MADIWRIWLGVLACLTMIVSAADGFGGRPSAGPTYHYYGTPPVYYYCPPGPLVLPVPDARTRTEPPLHTSGARPTITTTRSLGDEPSASSKERCRVGFWNLSGRAVAMTVSGKTWTLAKNQAVTVELGRQFTWQIAGRGQHVERVPDGQLAYEVVVRE